MLYSVYESFRRQADKRTGSHMDETEKHSYGRK
jgi:hypothetical protein